LDLFDQPARAPIDLDRQVVIAPRKIPHAKGHAVIHCGQAALS
jgi:hypothetical protein